MIKDYRRFDDALLIKIKDVTEKINSYSYANDRQKRSAVEFKSWLEELKCSDSIVTLNGEHYLNVKSVAKQVMLEMEQMKDEVLLYAFNNGVKSSLEWLLDLIPIINGKYQYAVIVDKMKRGTELEP